MINFNTIITNENAERKGESVTGKGHIIYGRIISVKGFAKKKAFRMKGFFNKKLFLLFY